MGDKGTARKLTKDVLILSARESYIYRLAIRISRRGEAHQVQSSRAAFEEPNASFTMEITVPASAASADAS